MQRLNSSEQIQMTTKVVAENLFILSIKQEREKKTQNLFNTQIEVKGEEKRERKKAR